jgi:hypothetical protein
MEGYGRQAEYDAGTGCGSLQGEMGKAASKGFRQVVSLALRDAEEMELNDRWHFAQTHNVMLPDEYDA